MINPSASIIVPVFNVEKYIGKCVDSILKQVYTDFELLLVDDGSKDNSGQIIDNFADRDTRVRVFHMQNSGASAARNYGLLQAKGKWVIFVDSDDYVGERYVADLINSMEDNALVIQGLTKVSNGQNIGSADFSDSIYSGNDIIKLLDSKDFFDRGFPVAKVFDRDLLFEHDIKFKENIHYSEDLIFMLEYVRYAIKIITISGSNYYYQVNASNLSQRYNSFASEYDLFENFNVLTNDIAEKYGTHQSDTAKGVSALMLMRSVYAMYINKEYSSKDRLAMVKLILLKQRSLIAKYYSPQIQIFKFAKKMALINPMLFHVFCVLKFFK